MCKTDPWKSSCGGQSLTAISSQQEEKKRITVILWDFMYDFWQSGRHCQHVRDTLQILWAH